MRIDAPPRSPGRWLDVLHVGPDHRAGGGMAAVERRLLAEPPAGCRLGCVTTHRPGSVVARAGTFTRALGRLARWCAGHPGGVVHVHATVRGSMHRKALCIALVRLARRPVVLHVHAGTGDLLRFRARLDPLRASAFAAALRAADRVLSVSAASARVLEERYGARHVEVLPNPAPAVSADAPISDRAAGGPVVVLSVGGFANPVKGGAELLRAATRVHAVRPDVRFLLAGPGAAPSLDGTGATWLGWLDEPARQARMREADVFVLPSTSEGLPMALLEAMAAGKAIVATRVGGVPDTLGDDRDALLVEPGDDTALADAILRLVADPALRAALAAGALERARELSIDRVNARLGALYAEVAAGPARSPVEVGP